MERAPNLAWAPLLLALAAPAAAPPAVAEFRYVEPTPAPALAAVDRTDPVSLGEVLRRLVGPDTVVRLDRRVDPARRIATPAGDWQTLLWASGLDGRRHGDELHVFPAGLPARELDLRRPVGADSADTAGTQAPAPAATAGTDADAAGKENAAPSSAGATAASAQDPSAVWRIAEGEWLRAALERWTARAGIALAVPTDRRWRLGQAVAIEGSFATAVARVTAGLAHLPRPPVATLSADGRLLTITHRAAAAPEGDGQ